MTQRMLARKPANVSAEPQLASSSLRINKPGDSFEQEADRIADTVVSGGRVPSWSIAKVAMGGGTGTVQRDTPDGSNPQQQTPKPNNYDEAAKKAAEAFMQTDAGKKLLQAVESDPLVKSAKDLVTTLPGIVITGAAATGAVTALAATHKPLPVQVPAIPLDFISPKLKGIKLNLTWEGPVDKPTKATIGFSGTFGGGGSDKKKKDDTSQRIAQEKQALQSSMDMFKPKDKGASDDVGQLLKEGKGAATPGFGIEDFGSSHRSPAPLPGTQGTPLGPVQQPSPQQGLQSPGLGAPWRPKTLQLLDKQLELKPVDKAPEASAGKDQQDKKKEEAPVQRKADPSAPLMQRKCSCGGDAGTGGMCEECQAKEGLQRKASAAAEMDSAPASVHGVLRSSGTPLDRATRSFFETRFGHDFSKVRIHSDAQAAESAGAVHSLAYTVGNNVVFGPGQFDPHSAAGRKLLAHELTHVVQQGGASATSGPLTIGQSRDAYESEADSTARAVGQQYHAAPPPNAGFRRLHSRSLQRYESGEHAKFGETGENLKSLAPKAFVYKVKAGEMPTQLAKRFGITEEELKAANPDKWRKWPSNADPTKKVEGFNAGEEIIVPPELNDAIKDALKTKELSLVVNGVTIEYGEGISMGDFYETPEQLLAAPPAELQKLSELILKEKGGASVTTKEWQDATGGRYLKLAEKNESHFAPSNPAFAPVSGKSAANHKDAWENSHTKALNKSQAGDKNEALTINAFADHFLTDAFAAGHLINKRDVMEKFEGNMPRTAAGTAFATSSKAFFDAVSSASFTGGVQTEFSKLKTEACFNVIPPHAEAPCSDTLTVHAAINDADNFSKLLQGIHMKAPDLFENVVAKGVHDTLNTAGVPVENNKGDKWNLSGDGTLNPKSLEVGRKAVAQSQFNVLEVFKQITALNLPALFKRVWDFVPHPAAGAGQKEVKDAVDSGTDPKSPGLISAAVRLINANFKLIADELVTRHILRR